MTETAPTTEAPPRGIGDNRPPSPQEQLRDDIRHRNADIFSRAEEILEAEQRLPSAVDTEEQSKAIGDFVNQCTNAAKALDKARASEKAPHLERGRWVDGLFKTVIEPLERLAERAKKLQAPYLRRKAEEERQQREAEKREMERQAAEARKKAEEEAAKAREAEEKLAAERQAREQAEADKRAAEAERDQANADAAEMARANAERERRAREDVTSRARLARQRSSAAAAAHIADSVEGQAKLADKAANAPAHELSRTRGNLGSLSQLKETHDFRVIDYRKIPKLAIWPFISQEAIDAAIRRFITAGHRELKGVDIFPVDKAQVR